MSAIAVLTALCNVPVAYATSDSITIIDDTSDVTGNINLSADTEAATASFQSSYDVANVTGEVTGNGTILVQGLVSFQKKFKLPK